MHTKRVRKSKKHKRVVSKVIPHFPDVWAHIRDGGIVVDELCGLDAYERGLGIRWTADGDHPSTLTSVLIDIYWRYMLEGELPRRGGFVR